MFFQVRLTGAQGGIGAAFFGVVHHHIGHDAFGLDGLAAGRVVARGGDFEARVRAQGAEGLHRALAKSLAAHNGGALVVLQGARHDFAGRRRTFVNQHHQVHFFQPGWQVFERVQARAALVIGGSRTQGLLAVGGLAVGGNYCYVLGQKRRRNSHRCIEQTTRVVAQVQHQALDFRVLLVDFVDLFDKVFHRAFLKHAHPHPAVAGLDELAAHRLLLDLFTDDGHREGAVFILAVNREDHLGGGLATHAFHGLVQAQAFDGGVVDLGDQVVGLDASAKGGRAFNRGDDFDQPVFLGNFDAHADKFARSTFAELFERLFVKVHRMRVQAGNHARDGVGDEFFLVHRLHIVALDQAKNGGELLQLFQRHGRKRAACHRLQGHGAQGTGDYAQRNPTGNFQFLTHTFSVITPLSKRL